MAYKDVALKTPEIFKNKYLGKSALVISSGHSTRQILERKEEIRKKFDVIIVVNYAFQYFDDICDFHLVVEKVSEKAKINNFIYKLLIDGDYSKDVVRVVNWKGIGEYGKKYNLCKTARFAFHGNPNIREYKYKGGEGLLVGTTGSQGFAVGSVTLSAMHFAGILGVDDIYIIGSEFIFKDEFDHFYKNNDRMYRDRQKLIYTKANRHKIIDATYKGKTYKTTQYFVESAVCLDNMIANVFVKQGVRVFDFSDGLISNAEKLDITEFLK